MVSGLFLGTPAIVIGSREGLGSPGPDGEPELSGSRFGKHSGSSCGDMPSKALKPLEYLLPHFGLPVAVLPLLLGSQVPPLIVVASGMVLCITGVSVAHLEYHRTSSSEVIKIREFWDPRSSTFSQLARDGGWSQPMIHRTEVLLPWFGPTLVVVALGATLLIQAS